MYLLDAHAFPAPLLIVVRFAHDDEEVLEERLHQYLLRFPREHFCKKKENIGKNIRI